MKYNSLDKRKTLKCTKSAAEKVLEKQEIRNNNVETSPTCLGIIFSFH